MKRRDGISSMGKGIRPVRKKERIGENLELVSGKKIMATREL